MQSAAAALAAGVADPLGLLRLRRVDYLIASVVVDEAARMQSEQQAEVLKAQARLIRNEIAQMLK